MGERRPSTGSSRIEDRIREVFMSRPQSRSRNGELTSVSARQEAVRSAKLAEAMQRQLSPRQSEVAEGDDLSERIVALQEECEGKVRELEEELRRKVAALRKDLEAKIARETADWSRRQAGKARSPATQKAQSRAYSTPRVRANDSEEEESKPKETVRSALQRLQESKLKLSEYQTLLRTPQTQKVDSLPKQVDSAGCGLKRLRAPQTEPKAGKAEDLPTRPKSLYERILALQRKA